MYELDDQAAIQAVDDREMIDDDQSTNDESLEDMDEPNVGAIEPPMDEPSSDDEESMGDYSIDTEYI